MVRFGIVVVVHEVKAREDSALELRMAGGDPGIEHRDDDGAVSPRDLPAFDRVDVCIGRTVRESHPGRRAAGKPREGESQAARRGKAVRSKAVALDRSSAAIDTGRDGRKAIPPIHSAPT